VTVERTPTPRPAGTGSAPADPFERARPRLTGRAYRILGVLADADDVVQEAWIRWAGVDRATIDNPDAWLNTAVTRLAIDRLRQRKRDEQRYVGPWLPSPVVQRTDPRADDPADAAELADSMTTAFLILLERLSPDERAAFLLADVFGERFDSIALSLDRSVESCRQLASRARRKLRDAELARRDEARTSESIVRRFLAALATGDEATAVACLAPDAVYVSDGGARRRAARVPVREPARIVRLLANLARRWPEPCRFVPARVGGLPGVLIERDGRILSATGVEVVAGRIVRITSVLNPDKLAASERGPTSPLE
jgi:RNA polymerase sigma-70 factor (ECF subfamily)